MRQGDDISRSREDAAGIEVNEFFLTKKIGILHVFFILYDF